MPRLGITDHADVRPVVPPRRQPRREHPRFAEQVERLSRMPGSTVTPAQGKLAADRHRDFARKFSDAEG
ncbi:hypothetical protein D7319_22375 [Streptomyces radicis]|uniref:Uncharacterized protein n=1 Tax=Streptomyces radicis TaxID=1750517 RepID=A0A3A9W0I1_9ACTN|nr:hypothetical protein D7319_22375 [Streptomyces radicis]RKN18582.1 hypothetical protein D7318_21235 [Streptomyces radicis]